jgi:hypothetical protein
MIGRHMIPTIRQSIDFSFKLGEIKEMHDEINSKLSDVYSKTALKYGWEDLISSLSPRNRSRYKNAYNKILYKRDFYHKISYVNIRCFIKYEKMSVEKLAGSPRLIQHPGYEYLLGMKRFQKYRSKARLEDDTRYFNEQFNKVRLVGRNQYEIADILREYWDDFKEPVAVLLDGSKFDAHMKEESLSAYIKNLEDSYKKAGIHFDFSWLWNQLVNISGYTQNGIKYRTRGSGMSGNWTTTDLNSDINEINIRTVIHVSFQQKQLDIPKYHVVVVGDDSVVMIEKKDSLNLDIELFKYVNQDVKLEVVSNFSEIEFCQCRPVMLQGCWRMVRNPLRALSRMAYVEKDYGNWSKYLSSVGLCELACSHGSPILQSLALSFIVASGYSKPLRNYKDNIEGTKPQVTEILFTDRLNFYDSFGITPDEQISIEDSLDNGFDSIKIENYIDNYEYMFYHYKNVRSVTQTSTE